MAVNHIERLRKSFPGHFQNREPQVAEQGYLRIPTDEPDPSRRRVGGEDREEQPDGTEEIVPFPDPAEELEEALAEMPLDQPLEPVSTDMVEVFGGHPGGLANDPREPPYEGSTIVERLAFYLPFHFYSDRWWGIYIFPEGIQRFRQELSRFFRAYHVPSREQVRVAKRLLYHHEFYHHATESFATRLEAILNQPCYLKGFSPLYKATFGSPKCLEETCANSYAREKTIAKPSGSGVDKSDFRAALDEWFRGAPPGYAEAAGTGADWSGNIRPNFYETCLNSCLPLVGTPIRSMGSTATESAWSAAGYFDRGIGDVRSRITYLIRKGSAFYSRLPANVRTCIKGRSFKQKLRSLGIARFKKQGGSHEIWVPMAGGRPVPIPRHDGVDIPKGTMRAILRQLGAEMSIDEFLAA